jgi:ribosomal protein L11 methyltransferase
VSAWWEIQILADPALEDSIFWELQTLGCLGTASQGQGAACLMRGYLPQAQISEARLELLAQQLGEGAQVAHQDALQVQWRLIDEEDWSSSWKQYWHPQEVGDRLLVVPAWLPVPPHSQRIILHLDPGMAFGTGTHATTQLCLEALEKHLPRGGPSAALTLADIGCGSGILAIAALQLGVRKAYAVDLDPLAVDAAGHNRDLNGLSPAQMPVGQGDLETLIEQLPQPVDGFVCNILAEVILKLIPQFALIAHSKTWGVLSGILATQAPALVTALEAQGWQVSDEQQQGDWCCLHIRRGG